MWEQGRWGSSLHVRVSDASQRSIHISNSTHPMIRAQPVVRLSNLAAAFLIDCARGSSNCDQ